MPRLPHWMDYGRWLAVPEPTTVDAENLEPKVQAIALIVSDDQARISELLQCPVSALQRLIVLCGRDDYPNLLWVSSLTMSPELMRSNGMDDIKGKKSSSSLDVLGAIKMDNTMAQDALRQKNYDVVKGVLDRQEKEIKKLMDIIYS